MVSYLREFFKLEASGAILLLVGTILGLVFANTNLAALYNYFLDVPVAIQIGKLEIAKPLLLWINDGLMAVFFFLIGLELKREFLEGELSNPSQIVMPLMGALGGMIVPALIYVYFNFNDSIAIKGWAIPAATDIAFALGVITVFGTRAPISLKIFLTSIAIFDDIGAILIIALFYSANISIFSLICAAVVIIVLFILSKKGVKSLTPYIVLGVILWVAVLKSGVHATLAGVVLAFFIPMYDKSSEKDEAHSPLVKLEHDLHPTVAYFILPVFAFANAGVSFSGITFSNLIDSIPLGIAAGLIVGKQIGVFGFSYIGNKLGIAKMPEGTNWLSIYGVSVLCGIGFTMSLFISSLAFENQGTEYIAESRIGILLGSVVAAALGYFILSVGLKKNI